MKKKIGIIISIVIIIIVAAVIEIKMNSNPSDTPVEKKITISVFDKESQNIYKEEIETDKTYLIDVLKDVQELNVVTEDSEYGEFILSIMGIEQGEDFYWTYYIDNMYATTGASTCKIESDKVYEFKIEKVNF